VPSDGLRRIIEKALLINRFLMKKFYGNTKGTGDMSKYRHKHFISASLSCARSSLFTIEIALDDTLQHLEV